MQVQLNTGPGGQELVGHQVDRELEAPYSRSKAFSGTQTTVAMEVVIIVQSGSLVLLPCNAFTVLVTCRQLTRSHLGLNSFPLEDHADSNKRCKRGHSSSKEAQREVVDSIPPVNMGAHYKRTGEGKQQVCTCWSQLSNTEVSRWLLYIGLQFRTCRGCTKAQRTVQYTIVCSS